MNTTGTNNTDAAAIQGLIDLYLKRPAKPFEAVKSEHLDEDTFAAFIDGKISLREAKPIIRHLVDCGFCRHVTAELVRLDTAFADEPVRTVPAEQPSRVSEVLNGLLSKIFGTSDGAVFAHEEKTDDTKESDEASKK